jgi:hypothetical protein
MLVFITSVRHPHNATDYDRVERLLQRTLASVCAQDDRDFRVVVVANQPLSFATPEEVETVVVDFPAPSDHKGAQTSREAILHDRGTKLAVAILAARQHPAAHIMRFDADDFVSRQIAGYVNRYPNHAGWYVSKGHAYYERLGLTRHIDNFHERCGTSFVIRQDLYGSANLPVTATQDALYEGFGEFVVRELLGSHRTALEHFAATGTPLQPLPFRGAVYTLETGENWSRDGVAGFAWPVRRTLEREFGLPRSPPDGSVIRNLIRSTASAALRKGSRQ